MPPLNGIEALAAVGGTYPTAPVMPSGFGIDTDISVTGPSFSSFGTMLAGQVDGVQELQGTRDALNIQAATGDLQDVHQATIAAAEASAMMDLMVALRNTSLQSFNELMRIQA